MSTKPIAKKNRSLPTTLSDTTRQEELRRTRQQRNSTSAKEPSVGGRKSHKYRYPHAVHMNVVVNRCMQVRPKPARLRRPAPTEIGDVVYVVDEQTFHSRCAKLDELQQKPSARVVGESFFAFGSPHERLLQLMSSKTGNMWYVKESEVTRPHILD